ncbi:hypothetical protein [Rhizobium sp. MHM7A]|uniref:hypothetical protein n=1 Tax=Rhizobium sp. MHM7A TaxID=2583233 RepID=UPI0014861686|nr:hypothetical protein [Rhizobium sp. MHM7A]
MNNLKVDRDNPNIIKPSEIEELGLEEADASLGPSWEEVEEVVRAKKDGQDKEQ